jgi:hypothetical protein
MKKNIIHLVFVLLTYCSDGQVTFNRVHPASWQEPPYNYAANAFISNIFEIDRNNDFYDGYLCFGMGVLCNPSVCEEYTKIFSIKTNIVGELIWSSTYNNDSLDFSQNLCIAQPNAMSINHNNLHIGVLTEYNVSDDSFAENRDHIVEYDWAGNELQRLLLDSTFDRYFPYGIIENFADSTYLVFGGFIDSLDQIQNQRPDGYLMKTDTLGNILWQQNYDETFSIYEVLPDTNGYWLIGEEWLGDCGGPAEINFNCIVIHTDLNGNEQDRIEIDGNCGWETARILPYDDHYVLAGMITYPEYDDECDIHGGSYYSTEILFNPSNNQIQYIGEWHEFSDYCGGQHFTDMISCIEGGYAILGDIPTAPSPYIKGRILRLDENLDSLWDRLYLYYDQGDNFTRHYPTAFLQAKDTGFVCAGYVHQGYEGIPNVQLDVPWIFKTDQYGCIEPGCHLVNVNEIVIGLQEVMQAFPVPFADELNITLSIPLQMYVAEETENSEILITDLTGRRMASQTLDRITSETNTVWNTQDWPPGIYIAHWMKGSRYYDSLKVVKQ